MVYILAAELNLIRAIIVYRNIPDVEPKAKTSYNDLLKGVFTASCRNRRGPQAVTMTSGNEKMSETEP